MCYIVISHCRLNTLKGRLKFTRLVGSPYRYQCVRNIESEGSSPLGKLGASDLSEFDNNVIGFPSQL